MFSENRTKCERSLRRRTLQTLNSPYECWHRMGRFQTHKAVKMKRMPTSKQHEGSRGLRKFRANETWGGV